MAGYEANTVTSLENNDCGDECNFNSSSFSPPTEDLIQSMVPQVLQGHWDNLSYPLTEWQVSQLENLEAPGVTCFLRMWLINQLDLLKGSYCNATWDNVYCWPPTPTGNIASRDCSEILKGMRQPYASQIEGTAFRVCLDNGTWLMGNWTNYTECADSIDVYTSQSEEERKLVRAVQIILFVGSILSLVFLAGALSIFYYFKCLWCDRVHVHVHLMVALLLRCALLFVITQPFVFNRTNHYRNEDFTCKMVLSLNLYAAVASINWMFIQGVYLHGRLTTNVFDKGTPFKLYYFIGWILPLGLTGVYAGVMETFHPVQCWKDYGERAELWILLAPIIFALFVNFLFLLNIIRILLTKAQRNNSVSDAAQFRRAIKATLFLFPLLGINNLLFLYNPGGEFNKYFVILNTLCGSTQGGFVALLYCFVSRDVRDAIRREYRRFQIRRSTNGIPNGGTSPYNQAGNAVQPRVHFRSRLATTPRHSNESSGDRNSGTTIIEMMPLSRVTVSPRNEAPPGSPSSATHFTCCCRARPMVFTSNNPWKFQERGRANRYHIAVSATSFRFIDGR